KSGWNAEAFRNRYSEVLERYDYIVGDWGYEQLRLKGFFKDGSSKATKESVFSFVVDYINEYCNFGCAYFVLEKKSDHAEQSSPEDIDPLLADLDQIFEDEADQSSVKSSQKEKQNENDTDGQQQAEIKNVKSHANRQSSEKQTQLQKGQEKKRRTFKQRAAKTNSNNNNANNSQAAVVDEAVKEPSKKSRRRPNRPFRQFDRKKKEQVSTSTQE